MIDIDDIMEFIADAFIPILVVVGIGTLVVMCAVHVARAPADAEQLSQVARWIYDYPEIKPYVEEQLKDGLTDFEYTRIKTKINEIVESKRVKQSEKELQKALGGRLPSRFDSPEQKTEPAVQPESKTKLAPLEELK